MKTHWIFISGFWSCKAHANNVSILFTFYILSVTKEFTLFPFITYEGGQWEGRGNTVSLRPSAHTAYVQDIQWRDTSMC